MIIVFVLFISSAHPLISLAQDNDLADQKIAGKVKALVEINYRVKKNHDKQVELFNGKNTDSYNEQGNKTTESIYKVDGTLDTRSVYTYSKNGLLVQEDGYNADGSYGFTNIYDYNEKNNLASVKLYDPYGNLFLRTGILYDDNGNETAEINYTEVLQDDNKHKDKIKEMVLNKIIWTYDDKGNITREQHFDGDTLIINELNYSYDNNGNRIEQKNSESGMALKTTYAYNIKGDITEEAQYDNAGYVTARITRTYDEKGNQISENYYDRDNTLLTHTVFQISYDKNNNWVRKVQLDNDRTSVITVRKIAYY